MEYISGETLAAKISARAEVPLATKLRYIEELCSGLHYAHRNGVIHRDVKPSNIMIDDEDLVKILDFGIAHFVDSPVTRTGSLVGTPNYMAPEQVLGRTINERTDVFAVGAVFYELLTSQRAFPGDLVAAIHRILNKEPEPIARVLPTLDRQVVRIVGRALAKDPGQRYSNLEAMATDIAAVRRRVDLGPSQHTPGQYHRRRPGTRSGLGTHGHGQPRCFCYTSKIHAMAIRRRGSGRGRGGCRAHVRAASA